MDMVEQAYQRREEEIGKERLRDVERMLLLRIVDTKWMDHIEDMEQLKTGIGLRALGNQDPAQAYANEGADMFELMVKSICDDMIKYTFGVTIQTNAERRQVIQVGAGSKDEVSSAVDEEKAKRSSDRPGIANSGKAKPLPVKAQKKPGRNDPCPCGSGLKYKNCHGKGLV
jgi:preprotein translocase subunit SecA